MFGLSIRKKYVEPTQVGKSKTVHLPLKIPQKVQDLIQAYWDWKPRDDRTSEEKRKIFHDLFLEFRRWHLYAGYESMAGLILIHTKVGVTIFATYTKHPDYLYFQATNRDGFEEMAGRVEPLSKKVMKSGQGIKYIRDNPDE